MRSFVRFFDENGGSSASLGELVDRRRPRLDVDALGAHICLDVPLPASRTPYEGLRMETDPGAWGPALVEKSQPVRSPEEAVRRVRSVLERAVEQAIGARRRVAVFAGGGIDSAALLAIAIGLARRGGGSVFAIAIDFESRGDDRPHMRALEAYLGCEVIRVRPAAGAAYRHILPDGIDAAPAPWPFTPLHLALFKVARDNGAECFLTGAGGDHFFDGDPRALAAAFRCHPLRTLAAARSLRDFDEPRFPALERVVRPLIVPYVPRSLRKFVAHRRRSEPVFAPWAGTRLRAIARSLWDRKLALTLENAEFRSLAEYFDHPQRRHYACLVHQEQRLAEIDRHDPYFSFAVGEEVAAIPPHMLLLGGRRRGLLREAMRGRLPDSLLDRSDKAEFAPAFQELFTAIGGVEAFAEELEGRMLGRLGLVDPAAFRREARQTLELGEEDAGYGEAWAAIATEAFLLRRPELL